ncbi:MAG: ABC transporter substrate-binding protein [Desulfovibrio sp.]|nr:ABC transporter substrate-binding protein [Desulfovibrio sp.]MBI4960648.1 ABC transporter substrate-binding protein [Desulfovibrio sp.]
MKKMLVFAMAFMFVLSLAAGAMAQKPLVKVPTCWMDSSEAFNIWYAKKKGWDKEEGLDIEMISFGSGPAQMEALPAKQWVLGGTGVGGTLIGGMRYNIYLVGGANAEDDVNAFYVRKDSPILKKKGYNPEYPDVYGTPETVKGSTILLTSQTTVHYIIGKWLEILGLKESDVKITNMEMPSIVAAFEKGIGDVASVWAPVTFQAESRGWVKAGSTGTTKAYTATVLVGDKEWCDKNPETAAKFLRVYYRVSQLLKAQGSSPEMVKSYQDFMNDFCGTKMSADDAKKDLDVHPRWTLAEATKLNDAAKGEAEMTRWQNQAAEFFTRMGRFSPAELEKFKKAGIVTDKFLKIAGQQPLPQ